MRVLVIGGAGFIGSHLVDRFVKEGFQVRVLDSLDSRIHRGKPAYLPPQVEFIRGDITDREMLSHALRDVDVVSHQAAYQDYMPDFSRFLHVNAVGTALLYELIVQQRLKVKKVIVASSQAVYGEGQYTLRRAWPVPAFASRPTAAGREVGGQLSEVRAGECPEPLRRAIHQSLQPVCRFETGAGKDCPGGGLAAWHPIGGPALFHHTGATAIAFQPLFRCLPHFCEPRIAWKAPGNLRGSDCRHATSVTCKTR